MAKQKQPRTFKNYVDIFVSAGAGVVIFAAWAKLTHQPFANTLLAVGMWTETTIFIIYAILEWKNPSSKRTPEVATQLVSHNRPVLGDLEKMLEEAEINPVNVKKLGESFKKLDLTVSQLGEVGDVVKSTGDFSEKTKEANLALSKMKSAFENSASAVEEFNGITDSAQGFKTNVQKLTDNLGSLNSLYELQLQEGSNPMQALNNFYDKIAKATDTMTTTVEDAQRTKEEISHLANNLNKLNQVYGNMLSAMRPGA